MVWRRVVAGCVLVALGCAGAPPQTRQRPTGSSAWVPLVVGPFQRVFRPVGTRYLNDHTLAREPDGRWHLFGITHDSEGDPSREMSFLHASAPALLGPWSDEGDALHSQPPEESIWAPFVLPTGAGRWSMFYYGNTPDHRVLRAESADLHRWERSASSAPGGRDPFLLRVGALWYLYSVGADEQREIGQIVVSQSHDLLRWTMPTVALADPVATFGWGNLESPVVVRRGEDHGLRLDGPHALLLGARHRAHGPRGGGDRRRGRVVHHLRGVDREDGRALAGLIDRPAGVGAPGVAALKGQLASATLPTAEGRLARIAASAPEGAEGRSAAGGLVRRG